ncbi:MAG TPA: 50S ribosomal protein L6 [Haloplasmataceae bacterium]
MSRIGRKPIVIPKDVEVNIDENNKVSVKGPKGNLSFQFSKVISITKEDDKIFVSRSSDDKEMRAKHGTTRAIIHNMVEGVTKGFSKELEIRGVGYRATLKGNILNLALGKSHPEDVVIPEGITVEVPKNTVIIIKGCDKQLVGEFAANIRKLRAPEPYQGKGIRYVNEHVKIKEGKTAK